MSKSNSFRDLVAWQKAKALSVKVYQLTSDFPRSETFGLTSQIRRAAVSAAANIAEGQGRNTTGEFKQFLGIARGSLSELETLIEISLELGLLSKQNAEELMSECQEIQRLIIGLMKYLSPITKTKNQN